MNAVVWAILIGALDLTTIILILVKLSGLGHYSWALALAPFWVPLLLICLGGLIAALREQQPEE